MDRRLTPANGRIAALRLKGQIVAEHYSEGEARSVAVPLADLLAQFDAVKGTLSERTMLA